MTTFELGELKYGGAQLRASTEMAPLKSSAKKDQVPAELGAGHPSSDRKTPLFNQAPSLAEFGGSPAPKKSLNLDKLQTLTPAQDEEARPPTLDFDKIGKIFGYDYCKGTIFKELDELGDDFLKLGQKSLPQLETLLFENIHFIQCVMNQYFACKLFRAKLFNVQEVQRQKDGIRAILPKMTKLIMRQDKAKRMNIRSRDLHHMDNIIDEYLSLDLIQR